MGSRWRWWALAATLSVVHGGVSVQAGHAQGLLVLAPIAPAQVAVRFAPTLVHLDRERPDRAGQPCNA
jgi:hypothetical protein